MKNKLKKVSLAALATSLLVLLALTPVSAQDYDRDPPTRVGRIGYTEGSVSFQPGGEGEWLDAIHNRPLTVGDNLWADRDSRAEVRLGSTAVRLGPETSISFLDLDDNVTQLRLSTGSLILRVRRLDRDDSFEIDTPNLAFNVTQPGEYRIDVNPDGDQTTARVWRGEAEISGAGSSYRLMAGQEGTFSGVDVLRYDVAEIGRYDSFDRWSLSRDDRDDRLRSAQYVSPEITGYDDLDDYGRWHYAGDYGYVWTPAGVPYGWAPYRYGHWAYVWPWGWTWVEDEPWGFAPFHYGRWAFLGGSWCWVPGPVAVVPVYSPALVVFVGGNTFGGFGGGVGWFPLGPGEVFVPWYRTSPRYVQNVNITNTHVTLVQVTNVYNNVTVNRTNNIRYVNQRVNNSVTVVNRDTFVNARPVANSMLRVDQRQIAQAPVTHEVVRNIQPERQSVVGTARPVNTAPPAQVMSRPVIATRQPVVAERPVRAPGAERAAAPPPVRTVKALPPSEARPFEKGARGAVGGGPNAPTPAASRPAPQEGRRGPGGNPENEQNNPAVARPGSAVPRPGNPQNAPERNQAGPRPGAPENAPTTGRPNTPDNGRPMRDVPRPPSSRPEQPQTRPEPRGPESQPERTRPETPRTQPEEPVRPENRQQKNPQQPAPPQDRHQTEPPPQSRNETAQPEQRSQSVPRPEARTEPAPRPEARPAAPPQNESRQEQPRKEKDKGKSNQNGGNQPNGHGNDPDGKH